MAKRVAAKAKKKPAKKAVAKAAGRAARGQAHRAGAAKPGASAAEHEKLKRQLKAAKARIEELEGRQSDALNRIDWAIDSLHNILEDKN